jgi:predicted ester cyclase
MMNLRQPLLKGGSASGSPEPEKHSIFNSGVTFRVKAGISCVCAASAVFFMAAKFSDNQLAQSPLSLAAIKQTSLAAIRERQNFESKAVVLAMDEEVNRNGDGSTDTWGDPGEWAKVMKPYWTANMTYEFIYPWNKPEHGLRQWYAGELSNWFNAFSNESFQWFIFAADTNKVTIAAKAYAYWDKPFAGLPAPMKHVSVRDIDFYLLRDGKIEYNWCMLDLLDLIEQAGYNVLPPSPLPNRGYEPPRLPWSQLPAPHRDSVGDTETAYSVVNAAIREDLLAGGNGEHWHTSSVWYGPAGVGTAQGREEYVNGFLVPLRAAFSEPALQLEMVVCEKSFCGAYAYWYANHTGEWLGAAPCKKRVKVRFGMHFQIEGSKIVAGWSQMDLLEMMQQMGVDLLGKAKVRAFELMGENRTR